MCIAYVKVHQYKAVVLNVPILNTEAKHIIWSELTYF